MIDPLSEYASSFPLAAISAAGYGPLAYLHRTATPEAALNSLRTSPDGKMLALDTCGVTGLQLLRLGLLTGGEITEELLAREAAGADQRHIHEALRRLTLAGLLQEAAGEADTWVIDEEVRDWFANPAASLADPHAITSDELTWICKELDLEVPSRKQEKIDAIAALYADPQESAEVMEALSEGAREMIDRIADAGGPTAIYAAAADVETYELYGARGRGRNHLRAVPTRSQRAAHLDELTAKGLVGFSPYEETVWIWREAWPALRRPMVSEWPHVEPPAAVPASVRAPSVPPIVGTVDACLRYWNDTPPKVLKSGEYRFAKSDVRATAKTAGCDEATAELISLLLLGMGLFLPNVAQATGRGRSRVVDQIWLADPELMAAWHQLHPLERWINLVKQWAEPAISPPTEVLSCRHLLLWELGELDPGEAWEDRVAAARWMHHRYATTVEQDLVVQSMSELERLGVICGEPGAALTDLGRLALHDPTAIDVMEIASSTDVVVQADLTVVAPPDLDPAVATRLAGIATLESAAGAHLYRLDEELVTREVQRGDTGEDLVDFLREISSVPVHDVVVRFVEDAAARADALVVHAANTVVVTKDPVDLATAMGIKSAKLQQVSPTVAISALEPSKVRTALDRRGLVPKIIGKGSAVEPRRASDSADRLAEQAQRARELAERHDMAHFHDQAEALEREIDTLRDAVGRFRITGPLTAVPASFGSGASR